MPESLPRNEQVPDGEHLTTARKLALISTGELLWCGKCFIPQPKTLPLEECVAPDCKVKWRYLAVDAGSVVNQHDYPLIVVNKANLRSEDALSKDELESIGGITNARKFARRHGDPELVPPGVMYLGRIVRNVVSDL